MDNEQKKTQVFVDYAINPPYMAVKGVFKLFQRRRYYLMFNGGEIIQISTAHHEIERMAELANNAYIRGVTYILTERNE